MGYGVQKNGSARQIVVSAVKGGGRKKGRLAAALE
jgi:hypothetical protein